MKTFKRTLQSLCTFALTAMLFTACSENEEFAEEFNNNTPTEEAIPNCATMVLEASKKDYDATRNTTTTWEEGDKLHLQFKVGSNYVNGVATYQAESQDWNVQYYGTLTSGEEATCEVYQFITEGESNNFMINLNQFSVIYADKAATYIYDGDVLKITANLTPMTGRLRFKGEPSSACRFSGMNYYKAYNISTNTFVTADLGTAVSTTDGDGYSPYYYGFFANETKKQICFNDYNNCVSFTRNLGETALVAGHSGFLNIPTLEKCNGWNLFTYKDFTYSNITFRMIRVITETSHYYVGETEVTQELWKAIMGTNPSTFTGEKNLPVESISYNEYTEFITKLNSKTGANFYIPTISEWTFAANGGGANKGYTYCGSNILDDVAWFSGNSEMKTHPVKMKLPNEIGIYDMNGNVFEWTCSSTYYNYSDRSYVYAGGAYHSDNCIKGKANANDYSTSASAQIGLRLFLKD